MRETTPIAGKLGIPRDLSDLDLVALVERRLPLDAIKSLLRAGLLNDEVYKLILPRRTLAHRVANRERLSVEESEKALRIARIAALAEQVFGASDRAWRWLRDVKRRFAGKTPMEMLSTEPGARLVEEVLIQLDHGMFA